MGLGGGSGLSPWSVPVSSGAGRAFAGPWRSHAMWDSKVVGALWLCLIYFGRFDVPSRNALLVHKGHEERKDVLG